MQSLPGNNCSYGFHRVLQESGSLLLWEGNFIKLEIARTDGSLPHQGAVNVVHLDRQSKQFVTAGADGYGRLLGCAPASVYHVVSCR